MLVHQLLWRRLLFKFLSVLVCIFQAELVWINVPMPASSRAFANSAFWAARIPYLFAYQYYRQCINLEGIVTFAPSLAAGLACLLKTPARPAGVAATSELDAARKNKAMLVYCMFIIVGRNMKIGNEERS